MSQAAVAERSRDLIRLGARLLGPAILLFALWKLGGVSTVLAHFTDAAPGPLALGLALNVANIALKTSRWTSILGTRGVDYAFRHAVKAVLASLFLGMVTPGRVGDVLRIRYLKRDLGVAYADGFGSVVIDRLSDVWVLGVLVAASVAWLHTAITGDAAPWLWVGTALSVLGPLLVFALPDRSTGPLAHPIARSIRAFGLRTLVKSFPVTFATFAITVLQGSLFARSLGLDLTFLEVGALVCIANFLALVPISVSGVGIREAFFAVTVPTLGVSASQGVAFGMLLFLGVYVVIALKGLVAWTLWPPPSA